MTHEADASESTYDRDLANYTKDQLFDYVDAHKEDQFDGIFPDVWAKIKLSTNSVLPMGAVQQFIYYKGILIVFGLL